MAEHPIIFSGPMVRAILEGRKTQTRRVVKPQPGANGIWPRGTAVGSRVDDCPYGQPGDRLWVRETFLLRNAGKSATYRTEFDSIEAAGFGAMYGGWKPSIHMPRWASRITLEIVKVRVERVQEISEEDALAEGCKPQPITEEDIADLQISDASPAIKQLGKILGPGQFTARNEFISLWNSINSKRGFGWDKNPWVWVLDFKRMERA